MSTGRNFLKLGQQLRGGDLVYVVDRGGNVHSLDLEAYTSLTAEQLEGSHVFLDPDRAERYAEIRRAKRN